MPKISVRTKYPPFSSHVPIEKITRSCEHITFAQGIFSVIEKMIKHFFKTRGECVTFGKMGYPNYIFLCFILPILYTLLNNDYFKTIINIILKFYLSLFNKIIL